MDEKSKEAWRIFVLADTHNRLPESVREMAKDADEIWHLGDVCAEAILDELRAIIGPRVTVVRGNCDSNFEWPLVLDLVRGGLKFRLQHVPPDRPPDDVECSLARAHARPAQRKRGRVLFLNPGCVTRPNRGAPPSVAWLEMRTEKSLGSSCRFADAHPKERRLPKPLKRAVEGMATVGKTVAFLDS